jgi:membrane-associated protease RseP (regulator of RpoE activity)
VREIAQQVGMVILIMLMILVFYNDMQLFFSS